MSISGNWDRRVSRKNSLGLGGLSAAALMLGSGEASAQSGGSAGYGRLVSDPGGLLDLPRGFQYRVIDGKTFFVNIQNPGRTLAIWGPFRYRNSARQGRMAFAPPPAELAPSISGELAEAAERHGRTPLEAAAFDRLGAPLV